MKLFLYLNFFKSYFMCMWVFPACISVYNRYTVPLEAVGGNWIPWSSNIDGFESACRVWKLNQVSFQVWPVLLIVVPLLSI